MKSEKNIVLFSGDSAYKYIENQLNFGFRVPGTAEHDSCASWIESTLMLSVDTIEIQTGHVTAFNGKVLPIINILGRLNPDVKDRTMLLAHYDTRPWSDAETDILKINQPVPGANDGASGVAVILELARSLKQSGYEGGVDFLLVDAEDYGLPDHMSDSATDSELTWCLGTQYWIENNLPSLENQPRQAILLDMVGGRGARFNPELISKLYAPNLVNEIWQKAIDSGYGDYFSKEDGNAITDDHIFFLRAGVPAIDIIENNSPETGSFNVRWHTQNDNIDGIDSQTLAAVGRTLQSWLMKK